MFENPFAAPGNWYRANLHAHTTVSDGDLSPEECADFYHRAGYQVLAVTDHGHVTEVAGDRAGLLLLRGLELDGGRSRQGTTYHIVGLDVRSRGRMEVPQGASAQNMVDMIREAGGVAFVAHPYWSGLMAEDIVVLEGCFAVEVYNTDCDLGILRGFSMVHWDDLLTLGHDYGGLAVDDGHSGARDHGLGWTMIRAEELSAEAVRDALVRGRYYASTGPEILDLSVAGGQLSVKTAPAKSIAMASTPGTGARRIAVGSNTVTSAEFPVPKARYCRIEVMDDGGKMAWSNPILPEPA